MGSRRFRSGRRIHLPDCSHAARIPEETTMPETCPNKASNEETCPCQSKDCERHGVCCECIRAHIAGGSLPMCAREVAKKK